ncbi:MAG: hypothetical protein Q8P73_01725 [bacterium]|nr:hypothetical protein [bacterium]
MPTIAAGGARRRLALPLLPSGGRLMALPAWSLPYGQSGKAISRAQPAAGAGKCAARRKEW